MVTGRTIVQADEKGEPKATGGRMRRRFVCGDREGSQKPGRLRAEAYLYVKLVGREFCSKAILRCRRLKESQIKLGEDRVVEVPRKFTVIGYDV